MAKKGTINCTRGKKKTQVPNNRVNWHPWADVDQIVNLIKKQRRQIDYVDSYACVSETWRAEPRQCNQTQ